MVTELTKRGREIFEILIADYISTALPVASKAISKKNGVRYSSATIRGILSDLERIGLLSQPHISAGRVPTVLGLRYYVDRVVQYRELSAKEREELCKRYFDVSDIGVEEVIRRASKALSSVSKYVGLVSTSSMDQIVFKQIQFISISKGRLLGIFVSQEGFVQNKIIEIEEEFTYSDLDKISNYCNSAFLGLTLKEACFKISRELESMKEDYDRLLSRAFIFSQEVFDQASESNLFFDGESQLADEPEFADVNKLKGLLEILEEKRQFLQLLEKFRDANGVRIFIGAEADPAISESCGTSSSVIRNISVVTSPFKKGRKTLGTLGVIGPMRMDYSRVVPVVDFTAKILGDILG